MFKTFSVYKSSVQVLKRSGSGLPGTFASGPTGSPFPLIDEVIYGI